MNLAGHDFKKYSKVFVILLNFSQNILYFSIDSPRILSPQELRWYWYKSINDIKDIIKASSLPNFKFYQILTNAAYYQIDLFKNRDRKRQYYVNKGGGTSDVGCADVCP